MHLKRAKINGDEGGYIRAEFISAIWRFVEDVEFSINDDLKIINVRSASRIETIRTAWKARGK